MRDGRKPIETVWTFSWTAVLVSGVRLDQFDGRGFMRPIAELCGLEVLRLEVYDLRSRTQVGAIEIPRDARPFAFARSEIDAHARVRGRSYWFGWRRDAARVEQFLVFDEATGAGRMVTESARPWSES